MNTTTDMSKAFADETKKELGRRIEVVGCRPLAVIRQVQDRAGHVLGYIAAKHDGTPVGMITAAKAVTDRMFWVFDDASNINSAIIATDASGVPRWMISPNFRFITEIETLNTNAMLDSASLVPNVE